MFKIEHWTRNKTYYLFEYEIETRANLQKHLGQLAADPNVDFTWYDAACVSEQIRRQSFGDFVHYQIVITRYHPVTTRINLYEGYRTDDKYKTMSEIANRHRDATPPSWSVDVRIISCETADELEGRQIELDRILTKIGVEL